MQGRRTTLWGRKSRGKSSSSDACLGETEDGEAQAQDEAGHHSLSCLLWVHIVMSSPGGNFMRYSTASSRVRFWKLVSFTCRGKALGHGPTGGTKGVGPSGGRRDSNAPCRVGEGTGPCDPSACHNP